MKIEEKVVDIGTDENGQTYTIKEVKMKNNIFKRTWNWIKSDEGLTTLALGAFGLGCAFVGALFGETAQMKKDALPDGFGYRIETINRGGDEKKLNDWMVRHGMRPAALPTKSDETNEEDKPEN